MGEFPAAVTLVASSSDPEDWLATTNPGLAFFTVPDQATGAENDLEHATALARQMIGLYGMSEKIGLAHVGQKQDPFLPARVDGTIQRACSEQTAREIDEEVKKLLAEAYESAKGILSSHRDELERIVQELLKRETLDEETFNVLLGRPAPAATIDTSRGSAESGNGAPAPVPSSNAEKKGLDMKASRP